MTTPNPNKRIKAHDLRICTWNVRSLNKPGAVTQLEKVLRKYKTDITALQEMRWTDQGSTNLSSYDVYYNVHASRHEFGCGFVIGDNLRYLVKIYCSCRTPSRVGRARLFPI